MVIFLILVGLARWGMTPFQVTCLVSDAWDNGMSVAVSTLLQDLTQQAKIEWEQKEEAKLSSMTGSQNTPDTVRPS